MIRVTVNELEPGMTLASPIRHPSVKNHVLLRAGYEIESSALAQLKKLGVRSAWIQHPGFDFLDEQLADALSGSQANVYERVKQSFTAMGGKTAASCDLGEYRNAVGDMIKDLVMNKDNMVCAESLMEGSGELFSHSTNVAYLSLVIGLRLKSYIVSQRKHVRNYAQASDLTNLGIGAMVHDLGKLQMAERCQGIHAVDAESDNEDYRNHVEIGYRMVQGRIEATATQVVLHHHQRFDGNGFPKTHPSVKDRTNRRMAGCEIHVFSRIVAVANAIDSLITRCTKRDEPIVAALAVMKQDAFEGMFDPIVLDAALRAIPPFSLGMCVTLSDGRRAVVTDLNAMHPCQPKVHLLDPESSHESAHQEIDLSCPGAPAISAIGDQAIHEEMMYKLSR